MATFSGDVQYSQNGTVTNPWKKRGSSPRRRAKRGKRLGHPRTKVRTDEAERWTWRSFQWFRAMDKHK